MGGSWKILDASKTDFLGFVIEVACWTRSTAFSGGFKPRESVLSVRGNKAISELSSMWRAQFNQGGNKRAFGALPTKMEKKKLGNGFISQRQLRHETNSGRS